MANNSPEFQEFSKAQLEAATTSSSAFVKNLKTISEEATAYSTQSIAKVSTLIEELRSAKSFESAMHIQSEYTKTFFVDFIAYLTKVGELYSNLSKEALKPIEAAVAKAQIGRDKQPVQVVAEVQTSKDKQLEPAVH
ncbi:phasin family protein [Methylocella silvestris]|uniref:Phasin n=1 Tax=Methylocella silvestris TaxID=199596 RepID=A0A2J7TJ01_METSI|nr:phasin family protein [Methylocella silvestris]PNG26753.1 Phasin [Methylocella silvestris]